MTQVTEISKQLGLPVGAWYPGEAGGHVGFEVKTMWGLSTVKGRFERYAGVLRVEPDAAAAELTIESASLDTGHAKRDAHLRSADFFNTAAHPAISFASKAITKRPEGLLVTGELTIGSTAVPLELPVEVVHTDAGSLKLRTQTAVPREQANLAWNRLGMIRGDALLRIELELVLDA